MFLHSYQRKSTSRKGRIEQETKNLVPAFKFRLHEYSKRMQPELRDKIQKILKQERNIYCFGKCFSKSLSRLYILQKIESGQFLKDLIQARMKFMNLAKCLKYYNTFVNWVQDPKLCSVSWTSGRLESSSQVDQSVFDGGMEINLSNDEDKSEHMGTKHCPLFHLQHFTLSSFNIGTEQNHIGKEAQEEQDKDMLEYLDFKSIHLETRDSEYLMNRKWSNRKIASLILLRGDQFLNDVHLFTSQTSQSKPFVQLLIINSHKRAMLILEKRKWMQKGTL